MYQVGIKMRGYRPYYADGTEIKNIKIYKEGKILLTSGCGWLEHHGEKNRADATTIFLETPVKRSTKLNLNRTDNFILKERKEPHSVYNSYDKAYTLYIHESNAKVKQLEEKLSYETDTDKSYEIPYEITIPHERMIYTGEKNHLDEPIYGYRRFEKLIERKHSRTKQKAFGKLAEKTFNELKKENIDIDQYTVEKLLKKYNLVKREKE